jgi:hypothetical protein
MACSDCMASRATSGLWKTFDPLCVFCGARLIQAIGRLQIPASEATKRRKAVLADWLKYGHAEKELRALVRGPAALEPETKERRK